jgi:hypothetical protein
MTTLFDCTRLVKPTRFGAGILAARPLHYVPCVISDLEWAAQTFGEISDRRDAAIDAELNREYDRRAAEVEALDRLTAGHLL